MSPVTAAMSTYRVLIVDDNERIHDDFRTLLRSELAPDQLDARAAELFEGELGGPSPEANGPLPTYRFDSAFQGSAALESVENAVANGDSYALAFVDIRMPPGWDGVETIQRIWDVDPNIHVILCSAYSDYSWEEIVQRLGASDKLLMLRKPFDPTSVKQLALATASRWEHDRLVRRCVVELESQLVKCHEHLAAIDEERER